jgi:hypothetical protein
MALSAQDLAAFHSLKVDTSAQKKAVKNKGRGGTLSSLISEAGGTGGALGGAAIGTAILPGIGTVLGAGIGGFLGGTGGRIAENKVRDNRLGLGDALTEGAISGAMGAGPLRLAGLGKNAVTKGVSKGTTSLVDALIKPVAADAGQMAAKTAQAPLQTSVAGKLEAFGNKQLSRQWGTLDSPTRKSAIPAKTVPQLADMGVVRPEDAERIGSKFTGSDGLVNKAVMKAVGDAATVPTNTVRSILDDAVINRNLSGLPQEKTVKALVETQLSKLGDNPTAPEVFKAMKRLEKQAADLEGAGGNYKRVDPTRGDMADVYRDVRDHLRDSLEVGAGVNKNLSAVLTPELRDSLLALHPKNSQWQQFVEKKVMGAKSMKELRSAQAPFVRANKMIENAADNEFSAGGQTASGINGIKNTLINNTINAPIVRRTTASAAKKLASVAPGAVPKATGGQTASSLLSSLTAPTKKAIVRNEVLGKPAVSMMTAQPVDAAAFDEGVSEQPVQPDAITAEEWATLSPEEQQIQLKEAETNGVTTDGRVIGEDIKSGGAQSEQDMFSPTAIEANIQKILSGGGTMKDVAQYLDIAQTVQKMKSDAVPKAGKGLNATQLQQANNAQSGVDSLNTIYQTLQKSPNASKMASLPGGSLTSALTGTGEYKAAIANATDVIGRLRSGGAINGDEEKRFRSLLPASFDNQDTVNYKLNQLNNLFQRFINPQGAAVPDQADLLTALGAQ